MADLLSELERFEQEMKELGSEPSPSVAPPPLKPSPAAPPLPAPPRPPTTPPVLLPPAMVAHASAASLGSSPSLLMPPSLPPKPPPQTLTNPNIVSPPVPISCPSPQAAPSALVTSAMPWLNNGGSAAAAGGVNPPLAAPLTPTSSSQFTFLRGSVSYPASVSSVSPSPTPQSMPMPSPAGYYSQVPSQPPMTQPQHYQQYHNQQLYQTPQPQQQQLRMQSSVVQASQYHYQSLYQSLPEIYHHPQQQQAQQLFQKDAQTITPEALEHVKAALASGDGEHKAEAKRKAIPRKAAGQTWEDPTLAEWPENDYRLFCGDLGNEVNDEVLTKAFSRFSTFNMARVVRDKRTGKTKGFGFVSFSNSSDLALALKEMNGKYVGNRPIKLRKSTWKERTDFDALEKQKMAKKPKTSKKNVLHK